MISIKDLSYCPSGKPILSSFSCQIAPGQKVLIHGRSGTGKTSLFKLILGFDVPDTGQIAVRGMPVDKAHIQEIRNTVFYLSQDVDLPDLTGEEIIALTLKHNQGSRADKKAEILDFLRLSPFLLSQTASRLSGGERQRLGLLLGFLLDRPVWLLDEPTSALDREAKSEIARYISQTSTTVLIISHDEIWQTLPGITVKEWS